MESDYHWLITIGLVTSSVIAVTANIFLLVIFCRRRSLRTVPNRFVINLLITNLLSSVLLIPLLLVDQEASSLASDLSGVNRTVDAVDSLIIREDVHTSSNTTSESIEIIETEFQGDPTRKTIEIIETSDVLTTRLSAEHTTTDLLCVFAHGTTNFVCTASIFSILLIGINQYFGVIHSLRYHFYINRCRSSILIGISWFVALLCAVLSCVTYSDSTVWHFCRTHAVEPSETLKVLNTVYALGYFLLVILAPFVAICVIYVCIYAAAHQNSERMRRSASAPLNPHQVDYIQVPVHKPATLRATLPKVHSAPNFSSIEKEDVPFRVEHMEIQTVVPSAVNRTPSGRSFITTIKHKISNASVFRYREETRAAKISILVIFLVLVCYVPYGITLILSSKCVGIDTSQIFNYVSLMLLVFSNVISPFLFGYRNKRVKREICKIFGMGSKQTLGVLEKPRRSLVPQNKSFENVHESFENEEAFAQKSRVIPEVIVTCKPENERKSILKRVCSSSNWTSYKKCNFITVPDSCISGEARGSFSSASTQISTEE
ncbi:unnamed protein product [Callosobruchus maculatus]|uniref:G-protein coupled receptors family 1 profile domain-containing protein n=2 Tax=Callosobruchus maculatus TaxID=64391 RepID=A0A653BZJ8_CALMS|nr:unnamed protein product [Callosobruchus maculatus]